METDLSNFDYYETLRNYAIGGKLAPVVPLGMDLFMKRGTMAWINAWSEYSVNKTEYLKVEQSRCEKVDCTIPQAIQPEITMLLANIFFNCGGISY